MSDDQFTRLFNHINKRFDELSSEVNLRFSRLEGRVDSLHGVAEALIAEVQDTRVENAARNAQLHRHEAAVDQLATHAKLQLHYE